MYLYVFKYLVLGSRLRKREPPLLIDQGSRTNNGQSGDFRTEGYRLWKVDTSLNQVSQYTPYHNLNFHRFWPGSLGGRGGIVGWAGVLLQPHCCPQGDRN